MITDIFRLDDNVPRMYVKGSRDFQMLTRLFTYGLNPSKYEVETLHYLNSGMLTNDRLLGNLCEKPGFMDGESIKGEYLRYITENFGRLVRDKGAETGILNAVYLYLLMYNLGTAVLVNCDKQDYVVHIGIKSSVKDLDVLFTILKYIVPTGWIIDIYFYSELKVWQGFRYKDTFVNIIRKASAKNALYIINTIDEINGNANLSPSDPDYDISNNIIRDPYVRYTRFGDGSDSPQLGDKTTYTHVTKYTGSIAVNAMSTLEIESLAENPLRLEKYGTEFWDATLQRTYNTWTPAPRNNKGEIIKDDEL